MANTIQKKIKEIVKRIARISANSPEWVKWNGNVLISKQGSRIEIVFDGVDRMVFHESARHPDQILLTENSSPVLMEKDDKLAARIMTTLLTLKTL